MLLPQASVAAASSDTPSSGEVPAVGPPKPKRKYVWKNLAASASSPTSSFAAVSADGALLTAASKKPGRPPKITATATTNQQPVIAPLRICKRSTIRAKHPVMEDIKDSYDSYSIGSGLVKSVV
jgi:hypothetical protein